MRQKLGELEFSPWQFCLCREGSFLLSWFQPQLSGFLGCYKLHSTCSDLFLSCTSPFQRSDRVSALNSSQELFKNPLCHNRIPGVDEAVVWCSHSWSREHVWGGTESLLSAAFQSVPWNTPPQGKGATGHWRIHTGDSLSVCPKRKT